VRRLSLGANLNNGNPETLLLPLTRFISSLPEDQEQAFLESLRRESMLTVFTWAARCHWAAFTMPRG
jgi:hypothetical protein